MHNKLAIIIPCHNESSCIVGVIEDLSKEVPDATIIVVNDYSTDNSEEVVRNNMTPKTVLLSLPVNLGIGGAVQAGLKYAARNGFTTAIKFDGDGQHRADEIDLLLKPIYENEADMTIGSRFLNKSAGFKSTFARRVGITIFKWLNSVLIRKTITDNTSGFRAYNKKALLFSARYYPSFDYPEPEEVILLAKNGFKIKEVQVEMAERQGGTSSISSHRAVYYMFKVIFSVVMAAIRPKIVKE